MAPNLLANPSFETDSDSDGLADNWAIAKTVTGTPTTTRVAGLFGDWAQRVQYASIAGDVNKYVLIGSDKVAGMAPGDVLTACIYIKGSITGLVTTYLQITSWTAVDGFVANAEATIQANGLPTTFTRYSLTGTLPATTAKASLRIYLPSIDLTEGDAIDFTVDGAKLERGSQVSSFFSPPGRLIPIL